MPIIDQAEIDTLLAEAEGLAAEAAETPSPDSAGPMQTVGRAPVHTSDPRIRRLLRIRVPVVVQLARRQMTIVSVRELSVGAIIEFEKCVEEELDLLINDRPIGQGNCVKVGENFGLRITRICDKRKRIESLGPEG